jgi:hypothetical protein
MINTKELSSLMRTAGWTAAAFAESLNSSIRMELGRKVPSLGAPEPITIEQAETFLAKGEGIYGDTADTLERWADRRLGSNGVSTKYFAPPQPSQTLSMVIPPVIVADDVELSSEGSDIKFKDITNQKARKRMLAEGISHSA